MSPYRPANLGPRGIDAIGLLYPARRSTSSLCTCSPALVETQPTARVHLSTPGPLLRCLLGILPPAPACRGRCVLVLLRGVHSLGIYSLGILSATVLDGHAGIRLGSRIILNPALSKYTWSKQADTDAYSQWTRRRISHALVGSAGQREKA